MYQTACASCVSALGAMRRAVFGFTDLRWTQLTTQLFVLAVLCLNAAACLPGEDADRHSGAKGPVSHVAAKGDRLPFRPEDAAADPDVRVATTARVVPTSAQPPDATPTPGPNSVAAEQALAHFFKALAALDRGERPEPVTILHLGDQHIAADRLTSILRSQFQTRFGDAGRGFMTPGLFRVAGAQIERRGGWRVASSAAGDAGPFGLSGVRLTGRDGALLQISTPNAPFDWATITFAAGPETGQAYVAVDEKGDHVDTRNGEATWQRIKINAAGSALTVRAGSGRPVHVLSWATLRDGPGLRYINLGVPGATALTHATWDQPFFKGDIEHVSPDLIVVGYGSNEALDDDLDLQAYAQGAQDLLGRLREAAPDASLLVIGPPDIARMPAYATGAGTDACRALTVEERANYENLLAANSSRLARWHPPLNLRAVRRTLHTVASENRAFFWDWADAMGGACSVHAWVHTQPPLASADHQHFTASGAETIAKALFQQLMAAYDSYRATAAQAQN